MDILEKILQGSNFGPLILCKYVDKHKPGIKQQYVYRQNKKLEKAITGHYGISQFYFLILAEASVLLM